MNRLVSTISLLLSLALPQAADPPDRIKALERFVEMGDVAI